jgi:HD superfamily phosphohydrolase
LKQEIGSVIERYGRRALRRLQQKSQGRHLGGRLYRSGGEGAAGDGRDATPEGHEPARIYVRIFQRARHTRLDHAVGVYHLAGLTLKRIAESGAYLEDRDVRAALAAALLLDAGRYPYAASIEGIKVPGAPTLKELSRRWIEHSEVAKVLRGEWDLEPHNVFRLVSRGDTPPHSLTPTEHLLRDILFGSLNVDALDRLIRDARWARVPYGLVEVESLIGRLRIVGQENKAILALEEEGAGTLQSTVFSRYLVYYNVYGHHALRIPTVMFLRTVQDVIGAGNVTFDELSELDDAGAFVLLENSAESSTAGLMKRLADRRPPTAPWSSTSDTPVTPH